MKHSSRKSRLTLMVAVVKGAPFATQINSIFEGQGSTFMSAQICPRAEELSRIAEDIQGLERLSWLVENKPGFRAYNGFEPSGRMHIAQALITAINANAIAKAGGKMVIYIADIFAQLNHKMGGDPVKIHDVGEYFIEVFKACGMDVEHVEFVWASQFIREHQREYFELVNDISCYASLARIQRTVQIMGRAEGESLSLSQLIYPCMQTADVFMLGVDVCQLGLDQRKVNMLAIEFARDNGRESPVILSHHMLMGLKGNTKKMSKSDPDSAIFIEDTKEDIVRKIHGCAFPEKPEENPLFEYVKYIILRKFEEITLCGKTYKNAEDVHKDFAELVAQKEKFQDDVAEYVDKLIQPIRDHFQSTPELRALLEKVESYRVTR